MTATLPPIDPDRMRASFEMHRAEPHVTVDAYVRTRAIELGQRVMRRERVYLDLCYWLRLRDVILGRCDDSYLIDLLKTLRESVMDGRRICPISQATFFELFKQQDVGTRMATARLIDELSEGVTLIPPHERIATEVAHFFYSQTGQSTFELATLVWSKLSYVLGVLHPVTPALDAAEQRVAQKAFFDRFWGISLSEMVSLLDARSMRPHEFEGVASRLNVSNAQHAAAMKSFRQVYRDEFIGGLDLAAPAAQEVIEQMYSKQYGEPPRLTPVERHAAERTLFGFLCTIVRDRAAVATQAFPTLHIGAMCHAAVRWDQGRKLTGNDLFDFHHAEAAVAYCDTFLADGPLQKLLQQKNVNVAGAFPCRILASPAEIIEYFRAA